MAWFSRSTQRRITQVHIEAVATRGRCALAAAARGVDRARAMDVADRAARTLARDPAEAARALAMLLAAGVAHVRGDTEGATRTLLAAARASDAQQMHLYAALARRQAGLLLAGSEGAELRDGSGRWLAGQRVARPERVLAVLLPGFAAV